MKRFLLLFVPVLTIVAVLMFPGRLDDSLGVQSQTQEAEVQDLGMLFEVSDSASHKLYKEGDAVIGECVKLDLGLGDLNRVCNQLGLNILNKYEVGENYIVEGVSPRLKYSIAGRQANVQIAVSERGMTIASPIIYGWY